MTTELWEKVQRHLAELEETIGHICQICFCDDRSWSIEHSKQGGMHVVKSGRGFAALESYLDQELADAKGSDGR